MKSEIETSGNSVIVNTVGRTSLAGDAPDEKHAVNDKTFLVVKFATIFILIVFAILTCVGIARSYRPLPAPDDWHGLDFFIDVSKGNWHAWFAQFLEHRPVLPRVFYWADFKFFNVHFIFPLIASFVFLAAAWGLLLFIAFRTITEPAIRFMIGATITLLLISWMQNFNFIYGWSSIQWFMLFFLVLATFIATALAKNNELMFYVAMVCGVAAAGIIANGIIVLPLAAVLAYLIGLGVRRAMAMMLLSGLVITAYFADYVRPATTDSPMAALADPVGIMHYILAYFGNVTFYMTFVVTVGVEVAREFGFTTTLHDNFAEHHPTAFAVSLAISEIFGFAVLALSAVLAWRWFRFDRQPMLGALLMLIVFVIGTALGTSLGRLSRGAGEAVTGRYTTPTLFALAALTILVASYLNTRWAVVLFFSAALLFLPRQITALRSRHAEHAQLEAALRAVIEDRDTENDRRVLGDPDFVESVANRLRAMHPPWLMESLGHAIH